MVKTTQILYKCLIVKGQLIIEPKIKQIKINQFFAQPGLMHNMIIPCIHLAKHPSDIQMKYILTIRLGYNRNSNGN